MEGQLLLEKVSAWVPIEDMLNLYMTQGYYKSELAMMFFSPENQRKIWQQVETNVSALAEKPVQIFVDYESFQNLADTASFAMLLCPLEEMISRMNTKTITEQTEKYYARIRRNRLYTKWFINGDHPRTMEPPAANHGRRRIMRPTSENYALLNPHSNRWLDFCRTENQVQTEGFYIPALFAPFF